MRSRSDRYTLPGESGPPSQLLLRDPLRMHPRGYLRARSSQHAPSYHPGLIAGRTSVVVLQNGDVIERGTHDERIAADGYYAELVRTQWREGDIAAD